MEKALFKAIQKNDLATVEKLLGDGVNANSVNEYGESALFEAVNPVSIAMMKMLLEAGANIDVCPDDVDWTPLMKSAFHGYHTVSAFLVATHANINVQNSQGQTALMYAAEHGYPIIVKQLLDANADTAITNINGDTALMIARASKSSGEALSLLENTALLGVIQAESQSQQGIQF